MDYKEQITVNKTWIKFRNKDNEKGYNIIIAKNKMAYAR